MSEPVRLSPDEPVSTTVYSVVWPDTEALMRRCLQDECEAMLARHRHAHIKAQDGMHTAFFEAWQRFAAPCVRWRTDQFPEQYPTAGANEAIRDILRMARWEGREQDLVVFDGEYEGYEWTAAAQGTRVHRISRARWRDTLAQWRSHGAPWGTRGAQWWISQPSAIDGQVWGEFSEWLAAMQAFEGACTVWVDVCYVGLTAAPVWVDLAGSSVVGGVVFSLSKPMGAYYRRIGGCFSAQPLPGLWGNRWFKHLDSLYLGERWLQEAGNALTQGQRYHRVQQEVLAQWLAPHQGAWAHVGIEWQPSDVVLLTHAKALNAAAPTDPTLARWWQASARGQHEVASRRLCLTPLLDARLNGAQPPR